MCLLLYSYCALVISIRRKNADTFAELGTSNHLEISPAKIIEPCIVIPPNASPFKNSVNIPRKIWNVSSYGISFYMDSLLIGANYQNCVDNSGTSVSIFIWMMSHS